MGTMTAVKQSPRSQVGMEALRCTKTARQSHQRNLLRAIRPMKINLTRSEARHQSWCPLKLRAKTTSLKRDRKAGNKETSRKNRGGIAEKAGTANNRSAVETGARKRILPVAAVSWLDFRTSLVQ